MYKSTIRIAAVGDIHYGKKSAGTIQSLFERVNDEADILVLCGDLTDYGLPEEGELLARELRSAVQIPVVGVLGNHDFESGQQETLKKVMSEGGITILDGDSFEVHGIGFAGVKGFAGGFGRGALGPWGEATIKQFVHEAVEEALKLETALARLRNPHKVAVLHYAPIRETVKGEPAEIYPYLGTSRLEEPLGRYEVTVAFHGHAHSGSPEGRTATGIPIYNVSLPLLRRLKIDQAYKVVEIPLVPPEGEEPGVDLGVVA
jgi:Icc-related predicted phosphoesterase